MLLRHVKEEVSFETFKSQISDASVKQGDYSRDVELKSTENSVTIVRASSGVGKMICSDNGAINTLHRTCVECTALHPPYIYSERQRIQNNGRHQVHQVVSKHLADRVD